MLYINYCVHIFLKITDIEYELLSSFEGIRVKSIVTPPALPKSAEPFFPSKRIVVAQTFQEEDVKPQLPPRVPRKPMHAHAVSFILFVIVFYLNSFILYTIYNSIFT